MYNILFGAILDGSKKYILLVYLFIISCAYNLVFWLKFGVNIFIYATIQSVITNSILQLLVCFLLVVIICTVDMARAFCRSMVGTAKIIIYKLLYICLRFATDRINVESNVLTTRALLDYIKQIYREQVQRSLGTPAISVVISDLFFMCIAAYVISPELCIFMFVYNTTNCIYRDKIASTEEQPVGQLYFKVMFGTVLMSMLICAPLLGWFNARNILEDNYYGVIDNELLPESIKTKGVDGARLIGIIGDYVFIFDKDKGEVYSVYREAIPVLNNKIHVNIDNYIDKIGSRTDEIAQLMIDILNSLISSIPGKRSKASAGRGNNVLFNPEM